MQCKNLFETIDALSGQYMDLWETVCNLESPTSDKDGVDAVGSHFEKLALENGW